MALVNLSNFRQILRNLVRSPSVVGAEHSFFRVLQRELEERGAEVTWYEGLLVASGRRPESVMLSAHIDRHGLICTGPNEFQYAAFVAGNRSDLLGNSVSEKMMARVADRFAGVEVYAYEPWSGVYRGKGSITATHICEYRRNLIFDVTGLESVVAGTPVAFLDNLKVKEDTLVCQLDNVLSVAVLVYLFELGFEGTAFFTAQEEVGRSWRYLLEWFRRFGGATNELIVLDTSPYPTTDEARRQKLVLRNEDANAPFNTHLTEYLEGLCHDLDIPVGYKDDFIRRQNAGLPEGSEPNSLGSTEMGRVIRASGGTVTGTTLQIPTTGYHTMEETAEVAAIEAMITLLMTLARG